MRLTTIESLLAALAALAVCGSTAMASGAEGSPGPAPAPSGDVAARLDALTAKVDAQAQRIRQLETQLDDKTLDKERSEQIKASVKELLAEYETSSAGKGGTGSSLGDWQVGYDDGYYITNGDRYKIKANGLLDIRYNYVRAENHSGLTTTALGTSHGGDMSGFNLNNAQIALSGYIEHNIIFKVMGNFGSNTSYTAPSAGTFQVNDLWGGYSFSKELNLRAGAMIIPYIPLRALANYGGSLFPDYAETTVPFGVGYGLGADMFGAVLDQQLSYDLMIGNGSNSQNLVDSTVPGVGRDNRLSIYTREQFAGAGKLDDFFDEPDVQYHSDFAWIVGAGFGWESQNSKANAFPGAQTGTAIPGLSAPGAGFVPAKYVLDGDLYRAALDFRSKYQGWSTFGEVLYQDIGAESGTIIPGSPKMSVAQLGYFVESGYFILPKKVEVDGRFGELFTLDFPNHMDVYSLGLNYYIFGERMKLQFAETFIPHEAALTSSNGSLVNTEDFITQVQAQLKF